MELIETEDIPGSTKDFFGKWVKVLTKFVLCEEDQLNVLQLVIQYLSLNTKIIKSLMYILPLLYKIDILNENVILKWWDDKDKCAFPDEYQLELTTSCQPFINFLKQNHVDN